MTEFNFIFRIAFSLLVGATTYWCESPSLIRADEMSESEMKEAISLAGKLLLGKHVHVDQDMNGRESYQDYWVDTELGRGQWFMHSPYNGKDGFYEQLMYANGKYAVELLMEPKNGSTRFQAFAIDAPKPNSALASGEAIGFLSGWVGPIRIRIDDLLAQYGRNAKVETDFFMSGESLPSLVFDTRSGRISFGFQQGRVRFVRVDIPCGTKVPSFRVLGSETVVGVDKPGFESVRYVMGPIEYDDSGLPTRIGYGQESEVWFKANGDAVSILAMANIEQPDLRWLQLKISDLKPGEFDPERIDIEKFGIPSRLKVIVPTSPVPYELRDGKLVKLADSRAEEVAHVAGFRQPGVWQRFKYLIVSGLILLTGMIGWYFHRRYTSA